MAARGAEEACAAGGLNASNFPTCLKSHIFGINRLIWEVNSRLGKEILVGGVPRKSCALYYPAGAGDAVSVGTERDCVAARFSWSAPIAVSV